RWTSPTCTSARSRCSAWPRRCAAPAWTARWTSRRLPDRRAVTQRTAARLAPSTILGPMATAQGRRGAIAFFVTLGVCLVALAVALNVGWIVLNWRQMAPLLLGVPVFAAIITGLILNTTFLVREIRRNAQHDAFVNAVTHELKTPVTSI